MAPEAYVEAHLPARGSRLKLRAGAFFLATSRENVDALWENAYAISSSALNSWFGEELRPIGLDASWMRGRALIGSDLVDAGQPVQEAAQRGVGGGGLRHRTRR